MVDRGRARLLIAVVTEYDGFRAMAYPRIEFTNVTSIRAEALGEPGQRTFRVVVEDASNSAVIWLEKEQLFQLAMAISQLQAVLPPSDDRGQAPAGIYDNGGTGAHVEFKVGKIALGHEGDSNRFVIDAHDVEDDDGPTVRIWGGREQLRRFAAESLGVCAAGRPLCPLCAEPVDSSGHRCARTNGHDVHRLTDGD